MLDGMISETVEVEEEEEDCSTSTKSSESESEIVITLSDSAIALLICSCSLFEIALVFFALVFFALVDDFDFLVVEEDRFLDFLDGFLDDFLVDLESGDLKVGKVIRDRRTNASPEPSSNRTVNRDDFVLGFEIIVHLYFFPSDQSTTTAELI